MLKKGLLLLLPVLTLFSPILAFRAPAVVERIEEKRLGFGEHAGGGGVGRPAGSVPGRRITRRRPRRVALTANGCTS